MCQDRGELRTNIGERHHLAPSPASVAASRGLSPSRPRPDHVSPGRQERIVCDHCRRRRIKCDYTSPCQQCAHASLECRRDHVPQKRGPKRGKGRVINRLRELDNTVAKSRENSLDVDMETDSGPHAPAASYPRSPIGMASGSQGHMAQFGSVHMGAAEQSSSSWPGPAADIGYHYLIPQCVELYEEHIYPIMPLVNMPALRAMLRRPLAPPDENLIYALSALTCLHMLGESIAVPGPDSWERAGRFFVQQCIAARKSYDFVQDLSLSTVIASFWLSASFFEIDDTRKSWYYLREALTLALELGLHNDSSYAGLGPEEDIFHRRVFWQLFVSERSFAILRYRPIVLKKTPKLPATGHAYESPNIHSGFMRLISSYVPLDDSFVTAWNDGSDPHVSGATYLALQNLLDKPLSFASEPSQENPPHTAFHGNAHSSQSQNHIMAADIQNADLLITQQWLRFVIWLSSSRLGLLSWRADHASMHFTFPLTIAQQTASILARLPPAAVEVHGMGILEKIFEISAGCINVLDAYDRATAAGTHVIGPADVDLFTGSVGGKNLKPSDPLACFVKTLSALPKSRIQFADRLVELARQRPGGNMALSYPFKYQTTDERDDVMSQLEVPHQDSITFNTTNSPYRVQSVPYGANPSGSEAWTMSGVHNESERGDSSSAFTAGFSLRPGLGSGSGVVSPDYIPPQQQSYFVHHGESHSGNAAHQHQQQQIPIDPELLYNTGHGIGGGGIGQLLMEEDNY